MPETGSAELVWMFIGVVPWLVPIAAGISAVITLHRIHPGQKSFQSPAKPLSTVKKLQT